MANWRNGYSIWITHVLTNLHSYFVLHYEGCVAFEGEWFVKLWSNSGMFRLRFEYETDVFFGYDTLGWLPFPYAVIFGNFLGDIIFLCLRLYPTLARFSDVIKVIGKVEFTLIINGAFVDNFIKLIFILWWK